MKITKEMTKTLLRDIKDFLRNSGYHIVYLFDQNTKESDKSLLKLEYVVVLQGRSLRLTIDPDEEVLINCQHTLELMKRVYKSMELGKLTIYNNQFHLDVIQYVLQTEQVRKSDLKVLCQDIYLNIDKIKRYIVTCNSHKVAPLEVSTSDQKELIKELEEEFNCTFNERTKSFYPKGYETISKMLIGNTSFQLLFIELELLAGFRYQRVADLVNYSNDVITLKSALWKKFNIENRPYSENYNNALTSALDIYNKTNKMYTIIFELEKGFERSESASLTYQIKYRY